MPIFQPRARHRVDPWLSTWTRPVTQSLNAVLPGLSLAPNWRGTGWWRFAGSTANEY
jgi:hypothetical protein